MDLNALFDQFGFVAGVVLGVAAAAFAFARNVLRRRRER
ncbi:MFS superfamily sulfate permease-like transporter [Microbacterium trichothecenolyticum]|uniref:MFS superfamily sulfate permease-like transporter n=1 Tax=Microbacterium trichothecenolyticum TaxID=69370 RepID=A0ABU0TX56_MICTR|nr:MFS superfamily sulfate permease-like transporter [Microbacterium trichothecenolyticum]